MWFIGRSDEGRTEYHSLAVKISETIIVKKYTYVRYHHIYIRISPKPEHGYVSV